MTTTDRRIGGVAAARIVSGAPGDRRAQALRGRHRPEVDVQRPALIVMAAGIGSRYGGGKQLAAIGPSGETLIDYSVYDALRAGFGTAVFVVREDMEATFRRRFDRALGGRCEVFYVHQRLADLPGRVAVSVERDKPWGTAHAVWSCRGAVDGPFGVINADDFYGRGAFEVLWEFLSEEARVDFGLVGYELGKTLSRGGPVSRGICRVDENGYLVTLAERRRVQRRGRDVEYTEDGTTWCGISPEETASMNMWGLRPSVFGELERRFVRFLQAHRGDIAEAEFILPAVIGEMVGEGRVRVRVLQTEEEWLGMTYQRDVSAVREGINELTERGTYPTPLWDS
jgi:hypothetical protein